MIARFVSWAINCGNQLGGKEGGRRGCTAYLAQKPCDQVSENDRFIRFRISYRGRDARYIPQVGFPFIQPPIAGGSVDEEDARGAFDQPSAIQRLDSALFHRIYRFFKRPIAWL